MRYEFQLRELWDGGIDPQAAFLAGPDLYTATTFATTLHYGPGETALLEGKTYGWRVRALVSDGVSETSVFRNNGYSEIFDFTYTGKCEVPRFILAKSEGTSSETIAWQTNPNHRQYQVQYRKQGAKGAVWFEAETTGTTKTLIFLGPATTYEFRVGGRCLPDGGFSFSAVNTFTTPSREEASEYNCGIPPEILITNQDPLEALGPGDNFTAGDFPVKIVEASGGNGTFSGKGVIEVPYLAMIKIAVVFDNISINTDGQMTGGTVETAYDADFATGTNAGSLGIDKGIELLGDLVTDIGNLFDLRKEKLEELKELQDQLNKKKIERSEFDAKADEVVRSIEKLDNPLNGELREKVLNSPYATEEQKREMRELRPTAFADNGDLYQEDIRAIKKNDAATAERMKEIAAEVTLAEEDHSFICPMEKLIDHSTPERQKAMAITNNGAVFATVSTNFDKWLAEAEAVTEYDEILYNAQGWNISANAQFSKRDGKALFHRMFEKVKSAKAGQQVELHPSLEKKGIYLGSYDLNGTTHKIAFYTNLATPVITKLVASDYCALVSDETLNKRVKVIETANGLVLIFLDDSGEISLMVQTMNIDDESFKTVLQWFGVFDGSRLSAGADSKEELMSGLEASGEVPAEEIAVYRQKIKLLPESERAALYLELQKHVPYRSQLDNQCKIVEGFRMCNVTSLAMNFEALGISNPDESQQFEDWMAVEAGGAPKIYNHKTWIKLGAEFALNGIKKDLYSSDKTLLIKLIKPELEKGNSISLSLYPYPKGHIVRVQGIDENGIYIDDPNGNCPLACKLDRENGKSGYDKGIRNSEEPNAGNNNLYSWLEIAQINVKYMVVFSID